jgi:ribonuclease P protein component
LVNTLKTSKDFLEVISKGQKYTQSGIIFYSLKNNSEEIKLGISIKKKTGNAVYRNKLKRQIKNIVNINLDYLIGFNLVVVNYEKRQKPFKHQELELVFEKFFKKVKSF